MIIEYKKGNLLDVTSGYLAHGVNCQGVMGSGIALQIREKYPIVYTKYHNLCKIASPDELLGASQMVIINENLTIFNVFSQLKYGKDKKRYASLKAIRSGFTYINLWMNINNQQRPILNIPKIGAGLGGLDWNDVERVINEVTDNIDITVYEL